MRLQDTTACRLLLAASLLIVARPAESQTFGTLKEYGEGHQASRAPLLQGADGAFYGTMSKGGAFGLGGVFRLSADGSTFTTIYSFDGAHGAVPVGGLVQGPDALYGTTTQGGVAGHGTVFKVSADGSAFSILHAFDGSNGSSPWAGLTLGTDGALYGTTFDGGVYGAGTVFRLARDGSMFSLLHSFQRTDGAHLIAGLIQGADGALYGTTGEGGAQTTSFGTIFRILTDGSEFAVLRNMDAASGGTGAGLVQLGDGLLYGVSGGGAAGYGAVFRIAPDGSAFSVLHSFYPGEGGTYPDAALTPATDGALYGTANSGPGSVFRITPSGNFSIVYTFDVSTISQAGLIQAADGRLYGTTGTGGGFNQGTVFTLSMDGSFFSVLHSFTSTDGSEPSERLVQGADGELYGATGSGGSYSGGTVFKVSADGSAYTVLHDFQWGPGALILGNDGNLYGLSGGVPNSDDGGTVFRLSTDGSAFSVLHNFSPADMAGGVWPSSLTQASDGNLYGTACYAGTSGMGAVFKIATDGSSCSIIRSFDGSDGGCPSGPLVQGRDGGLYGTAVGGGLFGLGVVFRVSTDGSSFAVIHSFEESEGGFPYAGLVEGVDGTLYGTAFGDGTASLGTIFTVSPDGSLFSVLHTFDGPNGSRPFGGLAYGAEGVLYGTTVEGGLAGTGTVFKILPDGSGFATLHEFQGQDGAYPVAGLAVANDGSLYGAARNGGRYGGGVLFRMEDDSGIQFTAPVFTSRGPSSSALVAVTRSSVSVTAVVDYATTNGSATEGVEYVAASGQLTFLPGVKTRTFTVKVLPAQTYRGDRSFAVALSNPQGTPARLGSQKTAVVNLVDTTPVPRIRFRTAMYTGVEGVSAVKITVLRSGPTRAPVTVDFSAADGTAAAPGDYAPAAGSLTFAPGITSQVFTVQLVDNPTQGPAKYLNLALSNPGGGAVLGSPAMARLNVRDNDQAIQFSAPAYVTSGAAVHAAVTVRRTGGSTGAITVQYATGSGTAVPGGDYEPVAGALTFGPGVVSRAFWVAITRGSQGGGSRSVPLLLTAADPPTALGSLSTAKLTIRDSTEPLVQFGTTRFVTQGATKHTALIAVKRLGNTDGAARVDYATTDGTAVSALDYLPASGQLTFGPGVISQPVRVAILSNPAARPNPTVNLALGQVDAPVGTPAAAILTIANGRRAGKIQLAGSAFSGRASSGVVSIPVIRSGGAAGPAAVEYATSDGSAVSGTDYAAAVGTLLFAPGETRKWILVAVLPSAPGGNQFSISLRATDGIALGALTEAPVWIVP